MGRAPCCDKTKVKRGPWSPEEDTTLKNYIRKFGTGGNWISLPHKAGLKRCGKSCRLRWLNYLRPDIKHGGFTDEEDNIIITLYNNIGSRWSVIASHLPGRTDNDVKNYWNTKLKKKLSATLNTNLNDNSTPNDSIPFTSTPSSSFLTEVNTYYHGNSDFPNISSSILSTQPLISTNYQQIQAPLEPINHQISLPRLLEVPEIGRGQDGNFIAVSSESNYGWCVDGGGDKDNEPLLGLLGSDFFYDLLNEQFLDRSDLCELSRLDYDTYASSAYMS